MTLTSQANNFVAAINLARSEAIRRNTAVTLSATASNLTQNHWEWAGRSGIDRNGNGTLDNGELLRLFPDMGAGTWSAIRRWFASVAMAFSTDVSRWRWCSLCSRRSVPKRHRATSRSPRPGAIHRGRPAAYETTSGGISARS